MKTILLALAVPVFAHAAPFLEADPYPASAPQPSSATFTINGGAAQACALQVFAAGALKPRCDLASITAAGTYTLVMTATTLGGCVNAQDTATCSPAGSAPSLPFAYVLRGGAVAPSMLRVMP